MKITLNMYSSPSKIRNYTYSIQLYYNRLYQNMYSCADNHKLSSVFLHSNHIEKKKLYNMRIQIGYKPLAYFRRKYWHFELFIRFWSHFKKKYVSLQR